MPFFGIMGEDVLATLYTRTYLNATEQEGGGRGGERETKARLQLHPEHRELKTSTVPLPRYCTRYENEGCGATIIGPRKNVLKKCEDLNMHKIG